MVEEVDCWLARLGLGKYATLFAENEITVDVLPDLTDADLKELGLPLGARKKIIKAASMLDPGMGLDQRPGMAETPAGVAPFTPAQAERRQLTLMFVDLVGSTAMSAQLDPEEMGEVLEGFQNAVAGEITRLEGHVAKYMGDGVLAYFGFPAAHEDDAERAVRAGLAIVQALAAVRASGVAPLMVRIGIATGLVVVGDLIGEGAAREQTVVGETPNLAARLQAVAAAGQVVVAETTRRLVGDLFELEALAPQSLKGITGTVSAFVVLAERPIESRFEARQGGVLGAIVGREQELSLLQERWRRARDGEGQVVLLSGEAGIGKSRITRGLIDALAADQHTRIGYQCSPYHADSALHPAIVQLTRMAGILDGDTGEQQLDKLERLLGKAGADVPAVAPLMATLLGLPFEERYGVLDLRPEQLRARTLQMLVDQLIGLARQRPVLFVVEDAHWIDPTTLEMLDLCLDRIATAPVMLLVTARPVFRHGFGGHPIVTSLALNRLGREDTAAIVQRLTGGKPLPADLLAEITAKTDGVPLFIEELTKSALESGLLRETDSAFVLDRPLGELAIPTSLHDSLMARLDRMQPVKEVAQTAACIGREFDYRLLTAIAAQPAPQVAEALERLAAAELIFRRGTPPEASYLFKHALVRDAAYESLLKSKRQAVHQRILEALAASDALPQVLGHHAREAGLIEQAIAHYEMAGRQAWARPAYLEAIANLRQAIDLVRKLGDDKLVRERELQMQIVIGQACIAGFGYGAAETAAEFARALTLLRELGESPLWVSVYYGNWAVRYVQAAHQDARLLADEMVAQAEGRRDEIAVLVAHRILGTSQTMLGRSGEALDHLERALQLYDPARHRPLATLVGQDPGAAALAYKAICLGLRGNLDEACRTAEAGVALARETEHPLTIAYTLGHTNLLWLFIRDLPRAVATLNENLAYSDTNGIRVWQAFSLGWRVVTESLSNRHEAALVAAERARPLRAAAGSSVFLPLILGGELASLLALGRHAACEALLRTIREQIEVSGELWYEADIHRLEGDLRLAKNDPTGAERSYGLAIDLASRQDAKLFELRACRALARLWAARSERQRALDLLAPVYGWFTEGFNMPDLIEAKALLDELQ
jgi:class 3 adenylate cyclase/predicted ATPase